MKNKKKVTDTKQSSMTLVEFKSWLNGLMEFQDENWAPSPEQWRSIIDKIMNLKVEAVEQYSERPSSVRTANTSVDSQQPRTPQQIGSRMSSPATVEVVDVETPVSKAPRVDLSKTVPFGVPLGSANPAKTLDIDTTNGYKSSLV